MLRIMMKPGGAAPDAKGGTGVSTPMQQPETQLQNASPDQDPSVGPDPDADSDDDSGSPDSNDPDQDSGKIDPQNAGYQGPDQGPFICANCQFFDNGKCAVVAGPVDHMGCCNNFSSMSAQQGDQEPAPNDSGGNTIGDPSNGAQSATDQPTQALSSSELA